MHVLVHKYLCTRSEYSYTSPTLHYILSRPLKKEYSMKSIIYRQLMVAMLYMLQHFRMSSCSHPGVTVEPDPTLSCQLKFASSHGSSQSNRIPCDSVGNSLTLTLSTYMATNTLDNINGESTGGGF